MKMKKLFQKINSNNSSSNNNAKNLTPKRKKRSGGSKNQHPQHPQTPPITPSPPASPLPVKILSNYDQSHIKQPPLSAFTTNDGYSQDDYQYYDNGNGNVVDKTQLFKYALSNSNRSSTSSQDSVYEDDEDNDQNIITSILGCGNKSNSPSVNGDSSVHSAEDQYEYLKNVPSMMWEAQNKGLSTIPEEELTMWGIAPSESSSDEDSLEEAGTDAIECVLQEEIPSKSIPKDEKMIGLMSKGKGGAVYDNEKLDFLLRQPFCQPCTEPLSPTGDEGAKQTSETQNGPKQKEQRQEQNKSKISLARKISSFKDRSNQKRRENATTAKTRSLRSLNRSIEKGEKSKNKFPNIFQSFKQQSNKSRRRRRGVNESKETKQKKGKWKCAKDERSNRIYYYHTLTREVSWNRPSDFQVWKATLDENTNKYYYYNVITKETTWKQPKEFEVWRKIEDQKKGTYYYNALTKEVVWNKPNDYEEKEECVEVVHEEEQVKTSVATVNRFVESKDFDKEKSKNRTSPRSQTIKSLLMGSPQKNQTKEINVKPEENHVEKEIIITVPVPVPQPVPSEEDNDVLSDDINLEGKNDVSKQTLPSSTEETDSQHKYETLPIITEAPTSTTTPTGEDSLGEDSLGEDETPVETFSEVKPNEPGKIERSTDHEVLQRLLYKYCPDEKENNDLLLSNTQGKETILRKRVESLISDTPFDELRLAIFSYVKETLNELDDESFGEKHSSQHNMQTLEQGQSITNVDSEEKFDVRNHKILSTMTEKSISSNITQTMDNTSMVAQNHSQPYTIKKGQSIMSTSTQQVSNTSKGAILHSIPDQRDFLISSGLLEKENTSTSSYCEDLFETDEEELPLEEKPISKQLIMDDLKNMESSEKHLSLTETEIRIIGNEELPDLDKAIQIKNKALPDEFEPVDSENMDIEEINSQTEQGNDQNVKPTENSTEELSRILNDTIESAYAGDDDNYSDEDYSFGDQALDDISALSDSLGRPSLKRREKERKMEERRKKIIEALNTSMNSGNDSWNVDTSWNSAEFNSKAENSAGDLESIISPLSRKSTEYEELPRSKPEVILTEDHKYGLDEFSHSSWDDNTLSSNFCSENEEDDNVNGREKQRNDTQL